MWLRGAKHANGRGYVFVHCPKTKRQVPFSFVKGGKISHNFQFVDSNMKFLINMKIKIMHAVESLYRFDTGQAPDSIGHNTRLAHALLTNMTFIYRVRPIASHR